MLGHNFIRYIFENILFGNILKNIVNSKHILSTFSSYVCERNFKYVMLM